MTTKAELSLENQRLTAENTQLKLQLARMKYLFPYVVGFLDPLQLARAGYDYRAISKENYVKLCDKIRKWFDVVLRITPDICTYFEDYGMKRHPLTFAVGSTTSGFRPIFVEDYIASPTEHGVVVEILNEYGVRIELPLGSKKDISTKILLSINGE